MEDDGGETETIPLVISLKCSFISKSFSDKISKYETDVDNYE
jgi:hypothetical protein